MKKLLIFLSFLIAYNICQAQTKIVIKSQQIAVSALQSIAPTTVVANPNGSTASPQAVPLGVGLIFQSSKLAVDTANLKDTIFAVNGLAAYGITGDSIGLGGRLYQSTIISGANAYGLTLDSFPAASGRGFRVNFGSDAGWDMIVRDSATGFWKGIHKGTPNQVWTMLASGGVGWANATGGSGTGLNYKTFDTITQATHGFSVGMTVSYDSTLAKYVKGDTITHPFIFGVVTDSLTSGTFVMAYNGRTVPITPAQSHVAAGQIAYQSTTAGVMTATSPVISIPIGMQVNSTTFFVQVHQAKNISPAPVDSGIVVTGALTKSVSGTTITLGITGGGGLSSFTSPNNTITIGGTLSAPTVDINPAASITWTGTETFNSNLAVFGVGVNLPAGAGTGRDIKLINSNLGADGFATAELIPSNGSNSAALLVMSPIGTGGSGTYKSDIILSNILWDATQTNLNTMHLRGAGSSNSFEIYTQAAGSGGSAQGISISAGTGLNQLYVASNGTNVVIHNGVTDPGVAFLEVLGTTAQIAAMFDATHYGLITSLSTGNLEFSASSALVDINSGNRFATRATVTPTLVTALGGTIGYALDGPFFAYKDNTTAGGAHAGQTIKFHIGFDSLSATNNITYDTVATFAIDGPLIGAVGTNPIGFSYAEWIKTGIFALGFDKTHITSLSTNSSGLLVIAPTGITTQFAATTTAGASINIPSGTAPTSPVNGDIWQSSNLLQTRINGITLQVGAVVGQTTLVSGTKAITITGITTSSKAFVTLVTPNTASSTIQYQAVCTSNTLTIQANVAAGTINASDGSVINYQVYP